MVKTFRWIVFLLAAGYCLRTIVFSDWSVFAGPFRFLTIWALFCSFFAASRMMALEEGRSTRRWDAFVSMTAVLNAMVVYLYWSLYFNDPASVTRNGQLSAPYLELYLHGLGPLLQWIDAIFVHRAFRRLGHAFLCLFAIISLYIGWAEMVVQRFAATPRGSVTSGLPYPFLNSLLPEDRMVFYASNFVAAAALLAVFGAIAWAVRKMFPRPEAPQARHGNPGKAA